MQKEKEQPAVNAPALLARYGIPLRRNGPAHKLCICSNIHNPPSGYGRWVGLSSEPSRGPPLALDPEDSTNKPL